MDALCPKLLTAAIMERWLHGEGVLLIQYKYFGNGVPFFFTFTVTLFWMGCVQCVFRLSHVYFRIFFLLDRHVFIAVLMFLCSCNRVHWWPACPEVHLNEFQSTLIFVRFFCCE